MQLYNKLIQSIKNKHKGIMIHGNIIFSESEWLSEAKERHSDIANSVQSHLPNKPKNNL